MSDESGGESPTLDCVDTEGIRCKMRLRAQDDGLAQPDVDYAGISWVYNSRWSAVSPGRKTNVTDESTISFVQ